MSSSLALSESDIRTFQDLAEGRIAVNEIGLSDPLDIPPSWETNSINLPKAVGVAIKKYAEEHSNRIAADHFGVSINTVNRHRRGDIKYANYKNINEPRCIMMREMAADEFFLTEIASFVGCSTSTVRNHVSSTGGSGCHHDHQVPRVDMSTKLNSKVCREMRRLALTGQTLIEIAKEFDIHRRTAGRHVNSHHSVKCNHDVDIPRINVSGEITEQICDKMRMMAGQGTPLIDVANKFNVSTSTVTDHVSFRVANPCRHNTRPRI